LFDEGLRRGQDIDLWLRLALAGQRLSYHRNALLKYRCRPDGLTGDTINSHRRELAIFDKIEASYSFPPDQQTEVGRVIKNRRALLHFEMGKLYAARRNHAEAASAFATAHTLSPTLKTRIAVWLIRFAPKSMGAICSRRLEQT
jgi:hypothetical protein